jgi:hypothetical protein
MDTVELYAKLRAQTTQLLGFDPAAGMTAAQIVRLDRVTTLRLLADDLQSRAVRGESIDVARFNETMQELERLLGGDPQQAKVRDFTGARIKIENLLDRMLAERKRKEAETGRCTHCGALLVRSDAPEEQQATPLDRLNMLREAVGDGAEDAPEAMAASDQDQAASSNSGGSTITAVAIAVIDDIGAADTATATATAIDRRRANGSGKFKADPAALPAEL